eukprot:435515_1
MFHRFHRLTSRSHPIGTKSFHTASASQSPFNPKLMIGGLATASLGTAAYVVSTRNESIGAANQIQLLSQEKFKKSAKLMKSVVEPGIEPYAMTTRTTKNHATQKDIHRITDMSRFKHYPTIPLQTVREHFSPDCGDGSVWVTWKGGVYDVTNFMDHHPGGATRIEMVGGSDLSAYWEIYTLHFREHIQQLLQKYRIGNLSESDRKIIESASSFDSHYLTDPPRDPSVRHADTVTDDLIVASLHPYNAEPRSLKVLSDNFYTPNELFWVRNHNAVPLIDEDEYRLEICGNHVDEIELSLHDLKTKFKKYEIPCTIQCAGNRQEDYNTDNNPLYVAPHWHNTAIGNAVWGGCKLRDVLKYAGLDVDGMVLGTKEYDDINWISFIGCDEDETGVPYGGMIPVEKAVDLWGDCLLVYEMNHTDLPRDHGYPIRLIAPGHAGCRQVKWVGQIEVLDQPSEFDSGSRLDRHFAPNICFDTLRNEGHCDNDPEGNSEAMATAPVIQTLPVQSIICDWDNVNNESLVIRGVAWAGGGKAIARVDVSINGGDKFKGSKIITPIKTTWNRNWSWVHFESTIQLSAEQQVQLKNGDSVNVELVSKAVDDNFNAQPENMEPYYNVLGVCINHWKRVHVTVKPTQS